MDDGDSFGDIPNNDHVVIAGAGQDIVGCRMPVNHANLSLVS